MHELAVRRIFAAIFGSLSPASEKALCERSPDAAETLAAVLSSLTPREERIVRLRFGIGVARQHTLQEIGWEFRRTRERIRQIEGKALRKLKHPTRSRRLRRFLDT